MSISDKTQKSASVSSSNGEVDNTGVWFFLFQIIGGVFFAFIMIEYVIDPTAWLYFQYFRYAPF